MGLISKDQKKWIIDVIKVVEFIANTIAILTNYEGNSKNN